jgi:hypothetical protein
MRRTLNAADSGFSARSPARSLLFALCVLACSCTSGRAAISHDLRLSIAPVHQNEAVEITLYQPRCPHPTVLIDRAIGRSSGVRPLTMVAIEVKDVASGEVLNNQRKSEPEFSIKVVTSLIALQCDQHHGWTVSLRQGAHFDFDLRPGRMYEARVCLSSEIKTFFSGSERQRAIDAGFSEDELRMFLNDFNVCSAPIHFSPEGGVTGSALE